MRPITSSITSLLSALAISCMTPSPEFCQQQPAPSSFPKLAWSFKTAPIFGPLIATPNGVCFNSNGKLICLDSRSGKFQWKAPLEPNKQFIVEHDGMVFYLEGHNCIVGRWIQQGAIKERVHYEKGIGNLLAADGAMLYCSERNGSLLAFSRKSHKLAWKYEGINAYAVFVPPPEEANLYVVSSAIDALTHEWNSELQCLEKETGILIWKTQLLSTPPQEIAWSKTGPLLIINGRLVLIDKTSGQERWSVGNNITGVVSCNDRVYTQECCFRVHAFSINGPAKQWSFSRETDIHLSASNRMIIIGNLLLVDETESIIAMTSSQGQLVWQVDAAVGEMAAFNDGQVLRIVCYDEKLCQIMLWKYGL